jgi:hypothetical protein
MHDTATLPTFSHAHLPSVIIPPAQNKYIDFGQFFPGEYDFGRSNLDKKKAFWIHQSFQNAICW